MTKTLIHAAEAFLPYLGKRRLFLRQTEPRRYRWFLNEGANEEETTVEADTIEEALRLGRREWKKHGFRTVNCGFRYSLPERDEHGMNALFHQMKASYSTANGIYFDDEMGNNCFVNFASDEALNLWKQLQKEGRL
jgi:hypothetical protein